MYSSAHKSKCWINSGNLARLRSLTAADRALHRKTRGRPIVAKGAKIVPVSVERELLTRADAFAIRHKLKRSEMMAEGLRLVMTNQV